MAERPSPNPDEVLGIEVIETPFDVYQQPRWEKENVQPKQKTEKELEEEMKGGPYDLG